MLKVINGGKEPTKGSKYSACIDLYANDDVVIGAGETVKVPLGVCINSDKLQDLAMSEANIYFNYTTQEIEDIKHQFLESHYLQLEPRSSIRLKGLQSGTGVIDLDFKDELCIILHNPIVYISPYLGDNKYDKDRLSQKFLDAFKIKKHDKIAQIMLCEHKTYLMGIESEEERNGGFGSTDNVK